MFDTPYMEFLGMIIGQGKIEMDGKKFEAIEKWKPPILVKGIQFFTGFANFYRKFIPNVLNIIAPLNLLTQKGIGYPFSRKPLNDSNKSFPLPQSSAFLMSPVFSPSWMMPPYWQQEQYLCMQADENSDLHSCACYSHTFTSAQWNYDIYDHELLAVILALEVLHELTDLCSARVNLLWGRYSWRDLTSSKCYVLT